MATTGVVRSWNIEEMQGMVDSDEEVDNDRGVGGDVVLAGARPGVPYRARFFLDSEKAELHIGNGTYINRRNEITCK